MGNLDFLKVLATIAGLAATAGAGSASLAGCCQPIGSYTEPYSQGTMYSVPPNYIHKDLRSLTATVSSGTSQTHQACRPHRDQQPSSLQDAY